MHSILQISQDNDSATVAGMAGESSLLGGIMAGVGDIAAQGYDIHAGTQTSVNWKQTGKSTLTGGAAGFVMGGAMGMFSLTSAGQALGKWMSEPTKLDVKAAQMVKSFWGNNRGSVGFGTKAGGNGVKNGATRAACYSSEWADASLQEAINKFAPNVEPVVTSKGKVIYSNPETGISVVYDKNGNYFRIEDTTRPCGRNYLDVDGNDMNNEIINGKTRGRNRSDYQKFTHFNNTDK